MVAAHRPTQINAIRIMYHLSGESNAIDHIIETNLVDIVLQLVTSENYIGVERELAALIVNVSSLRALVYVTRELKICSAEKKMLIVSLHSVRLL